MLLALEGVLLDDRRARFARSGERDHRARTAVASQDGLPFAPPDSRGSTLRSAPGESGAPTHGSVMPSAEPLWLDGGRAHLAAALALTTCVACAWNDRGLVDVTCAANATARELSVEAWGLHLLTFTPEATLALGRSRSTYVFPAEAAAGDTARSPVELASPDPLSSAPASECHDIGKGFDASQPYLVRSRIDGLSLSAGAARVGVSIGRRSSMRLSVPEGGAYVVRVRSTGVDGAIEASMRRTE